MENTPRPLPIRLECINPVVPVRDINVSRQYYTNVLGFTESDWGRDLTFTSMSRDRSSFYMCQGTEQGNYGCWLWVGFDGDMEALYEALKHNGAIIKMPPTNFSWALEMHVADPDGNVLRFGTGPITSEPYLDGKMFP